MNDEFVPGHQFQKAGYEIEIQEEIYSETLAEEEQENVNTIDMVNLHLF